MPRTTPGHARVRRFAVALSALAVGVTATPATAHAEPAGTSQAPAPVEFDTRGCPDRADLPAGAAPADWRCEVMSATGRLTLGRIDQAIDVPMTLTFAEGTVDGEYQQVFGEMKAAPLPVLGTTWKVTPRYAGYSDFQADDQRRGELALTFPITGPGVPHGCTIGTDDAPVHLVLQQTDPTTVVSRDPLVVSFGVADDGFAAPRVSGCGRLGPALDAVLRLPSPSGANAIDLDARTALYPYEQLAPATPAQAG
ncbi:hypothetical protein AQ490_23735 [Wenjunlia vitaminophila]|uniref:Secreted protein n=1 Tax=Wenjunlia vitaminophila TaxID=76728 RepID=A0A0T6LS54_WENVI|nr:hypothetical protein [Wenjunlia vitaminophila]KRV48870.1 hypothetical protein AQ490_23735 [Wenjunlia vitaminophila]